jgi:nitroreductase
MVEVMDIIKGRRTIRKYQEKQVPNEILQRILETARSATSCIEKQCWEVIVVKDQSKKEKLRETLYKTNPARNAVVQAPIVLALCGKINCSGDYKVMFELGIAAQTICLTAYDLGLGTAIVAYLDHNKAEEILELPKGYELVSLISLGYPAESPTAPKRREISEFVHYEKF